eukprot:5520340-Pyramimonas_sp.AAC.1
MFKRHLDYLTKWHFVVCGNNDRAGVILTSFCAADLVFIGSGATRNEGLFVGPCAALNMCGYAPAPHHVLSPTR